MEKNKELDALVNQYYFGHDLEWKNSKLYTGWFYRGSSEFNFEMWTPFSPSRDANDAKTLLNKLKEMYKGHIRIFVDEDTTSVYIDPQIAYGTEAELEEALCRAAVAAYEKTIQNN